MYRERERERERDGGKKGMMEIESVSEHYGSAPGGRGRGGGGEIRMVPVD